MIDYYKERAKGGVGLIIVEYTVVEYPQGKGGATTLSIHDEPLIPGHNMLVETVHRQGAKIALQLSHLGNRASPIFTGQQPAGPSPIPCVILGIVPRELTIKEIEMLIDLFVKGAERARDSGYDAIELHGAHGHLVSQFMSPYFNERTDCYGGNLENRMRFPLEIVKRVREKLGEDYPIIFRLSGDEFVKGGRNLEESVQIASMVEEIGISAIHVTAGIRETYNTTIEPMPYEQGWKIYMAETIKRAVSIPVIAVGVIREPQFAEDVLKEGKADFISIGRGLIADPEWPRKAATGREEDIRRCISCVCCYGRIERSLSLRCAINPDVGFERESLDMKPATVKKKVMVIGGGPAGMEAARIASRRGHEVFLFEKEKELGGQLRLASIPPGKEKINWLTDYLGNQIRKSHVDINVGIKIDAKKVDEVRPDVVVIATGARAAIPEFPLRDKKLRRKILTAWEVLEGKHEFLREEEIVVLGGFVLGCEIAEFLASRGNKVSIITRSNQIAINTNNITREDLSQRLHKRGVTIYTKHDVSEIVEDGINLMDDKGKLVHIKADRIISTRLVVPVKELKEILYGKVKEIYHIGDSKEPRRIAEAILEGSMVGRWI
jgi:2,4-dienoyl-CoA reductase-like NADH-dependent reductase (Old Yellow Enzyme family)/thioredoxin reductase